MREEKCISFYYEKHPDIYNAINRDREFEKQVEFFGRFIDKLKPINFLELFAGPAYHCVTASKKFNWEVYAIDNKQSMKKVAVKSGFEKDNHFVVGELPLAIDKIEIENEIDCVFIPRYSIGYIKRSEIVLLFEKLRRLLSDCGRIFIEVHNISLITKGLNDLGIIKRTSILEDGREVSCLWPDGEIGWASEDHIASMPVRIDINNKSLSFISKERIYSADEIIFIAGLAGFKSVNLETFEKDIKLTFPGANLVSLRMDS